MKFVLIFITLLGNYALLAQKIDTLIIKQKIFLNVESQFSAIDNKTVPGVFLYPNPAKNKVEISVKGFQPGKIQIQLFNNSGVMVRQDNRTVFSGTEQIIFMFFQPPGIYYLLVKQGSILIKNRLLVQ